MLANPDMECDVISYWYKKSAHVVFRRALNLNSEHAMRLEEDKTYKFIMSWGLFDNHTDSDKSKVLGGTDWGNETHVFEVLMPLKTVSSAWWLSSGVIALLVLNY